MPRKESGGKMLSVGDVMVSKVRTIQSTKTVAAVAREMARWKVGSLIVMKDGGIVGIVTEGDVSRSVARGESPGRTRLGAIISGKLIVVDPDEELEGAAKVMAEQGVKKLPVIKDGRLVGIVTQSDVVRVNFPLVTTLKEMVASRYRPPGFEA